MHTVKFSSIFKQDNRKKKSPPPKLLCQQKPMAEGHVPAQTGSSEEGRTSLTVPGRTDFLKDQNAFESRSLVQPITGDRQLQSSIAL